MDACAAENVLIAASEVDERLLESLASSRATLVRTFEEAQRALRDQLFRLIVIDLSFDNVRMFDLLRYVRSIARFNGVPVLCIHGGDGGVGISAALDSVVRALGGKACIDLRGNDRAPRGRLCILIVDHDVDSAHRLGELLEQLGHDVDLAYDAAAGLDAARRLRPDAVFVDLAQRPGDGYRLARRLRRECNGVNVLLVALAPALREEDCRRMREAGFDEHLLKSVPLQGIDELLQRHLVRSREMPAGWASGARRPAA